MKLFLIPTLLAPETHQMLPETLKEVLPSLQYFMVENERTARRFLSDLQLGLNIRELTFFRLDKDTERAMAESYFQQIPKGQAAGVIAESGCPGIADPGALVVEIAHKLDWEVVPIPGPSSILLALMGSGMNGQQFVFHGYLPIQKDQRKREIKKLELNSAKQKQTQIFIETPYRNQQLLADLLETCHQHTRLCIGRNLTAPDALLQTKSVAEWKKEKINLHKQPTIFLLMA